MRLEDLFGSGWETQEFPAALCTHPAKEAGVREAEEAFLCLLVDKRFEAYGGIEVLRPYTAEKLPEDGPGVLFGWVDESGNIRDHFENNVHDDDNVVVAWRRLGSPLDLRDLVGGRRLMKIPGIDINLGHCRNRSCPANRYIPLPNGGWMCLDCGLQMPLAEVEVEEVRQPWASSLRETD